MIGKLSWGAVASVGVVDASVVEVVCSGSVVLVGLEVGACVQATKLIKINKLLIMLIVFFIIGILSLCSG